jgi:hypothetical protein
MELHDVLSRKSGKGIVEAWFIAASHENAWTTEAAEEFQKAKSLLKKKSNTETRISPQISCCWSCFNQVCLGLGW